MMAMRLAVLVTVLVKLLTKMAKIAMAFHLQLLEGELEVFQKS